MSLESFEFLELLKEVQKADPDIALLTHDRQSETITRWRDEWIRAKNLALVPGDKILEFGVLLAKSAETYSFYEEADEIFSTFTEAAVRGEGWVGDQVALLVTAGEYQRRVMKLSAAETTFLLAEKVCRDKSESEGWPRSSFKNLGRLYYELAYLGRLRGDAAAAIAWLERSATVCEVAGDTVGAEVAYTLKDVVLCEEGEAEKAIERLQTHLEAFEMLEKEPRIIETGRNGFARRWALNAKYHLAQAYVAAEKPEGARTIFDRLYADMPNSASAATNGTFLRVEALIWLQRRDLERFNAALSGSRKAIEGQAGTDVGLTEAGAAIYTLNGVLGYLKGNVVVAKSEFAKAQMCNPEFHNSRMQGLAAAGEALIARDKGDHRIMMESIALGLARVHRCGAPIRSFLLEIQRGCLTKEEVPTFDDLRCIVARFC